MGGAIHACVPYSISILLAIDYYNIILIDLEWVGTYGVTVVMNGMYTDWIDM